MSPFTSLSPAARWYVTAVAAVGGGVLVSSIYQLITYDVDERWFVLVGLTLLTSSITVKIPSVTATLSISEVFVFSAFILFGPAAGIVLAALDGLVISLWLQRRRQPAYRVIFNAATPALSVWLGSLVYHGVGAPPINAVDFQVTQILVPLCAFATTYFLANTFLIAAAIALEQKVSAIQVWKKNFAWLWLNYFSGASMASLLVSFGGRDGASALRAIWIVLPLLAISYVTYKSSMARIEDANKHVDQLNSLYLSTIETLAMAIDAKDQITHGHIRRVQTYAVALAREIGVIDDSQIRAIGAASLLHDMGKLAVPEYILNKPGPLTPAEFERMKQHAAVGADILSSIDFPYPVVPIVRHHHESWDGSGYPGGLRGADIPIGARVLSVVDCFDALTSDRPYRPRLTDEDALHVLRDRRGTMYDPLIVDAFFGLYQRLKREEESGKPLENSSKNLVLAKPQTSFPKLAAISASAGESRTMYRLIQRLAAEQSYSAALDDVVEEISNLIPATVVAFYSPIEDGTELEVTNAIGSHTDWLKGRKVRMGERIVGWSASSGRSVLNADATGEFGEMARSFPTPLKSCLTVPVSAETGQLGIVAAFSPDDAGFRTEDQRLVEAVVRHVTPVLERLRPRSGGSPVHLPTSDGLDLTPQGMIACRCAPSTSAGSESVGIALAVVRRHLGNHALTQIVHGSDIFIGIGHSGIDSIETIAEGLRSTLLGSGLLETGSNVAVAVTPKDGTNLEHLLYACRQRLSPRTNQVNRVH
ncbi:MAG: HD domain-containing phosphohydrolase [Vicinamibacterales bacterium]